MSVNTEKMTPEQVRTLGLEILSRELGPAGMLRFIQLFDAGHGDYSKERHHLLSDQNVDDVLDEIKGHRKNPE